MTTDIPTLLHGVDLATLAERDGVQLRGNTTGERYGACPKCGGHDRFHLRHHDGRDYFFCRKCHDKRGDAIEYMSWLHGMSFPEAVKALGGDTAAMPKAARLAPPPKPAEVAPCAEWQAVAREFIDRCAATLWQAEGAKALDWLHARGLSDDTLRRFNIGYHAQDERIGGALNLWADRGVTIPCVVLGDVWGVNIRRATGEPKYRKLQGSRAALFNYAALDGALTALLCAGEFDAMLAQQHAPTGLVCCTFGSESKNPSLRWTLALDSVKRRLVCFDNDDAGKQGATKWHEMAEAVRLPNGKDVTEFHKADGDVAAWLCGLIGAPPTPCDAEQFLAHERAAFERAGYQFAVVPVGQHTGIVAVASTQAARRGDDDDALFAMLIKRGFEPEYNPDGHIVAHARAAATAAATAVTHG